MIHELYFTADDRIFRKHLKNRKGRKMLKKTEKTPAEAVSTACLDVCEDVSSGEQAPRPPPLTYIISAKSPLRLAKT